MANPPMITLDEYLGEDALTRRRIIDAAAGLFRDRGFLSVSMAEVATAVGLSKPGLYHHWPSKEALLGTIAHLSSELLLRQLDEVRSLSAGPEDRMRAYMRSRLGIIARHQDIFTVTWQERAVLGSTSFAELSRTAELYRAGVRQLLDEAKRDGLIHADVDTHLLMLALDGMTGWAYFWYRESGLLRPTQIADAFWDMLANGIAKPSDR